MKRKKKNGVNGHVVGLVEQCRAQVEAFFNDSDKAALWFETPNPMLGGITPTVMVQMGREQKLLEIITSTLAENVVPPGRCPCGNPPTYIGMQRLNHLWYTVAFKCDGCGKTWNEELSSAAAHTARAESDRRKEISDA